ncbi:MAG: flap endonuclease-1 [Desulfurococcaceae archaeon]
MGVNLKDLIPSEVKVEVDDLRVFRGRVIAIDAYNALYQFLTAIRQPDGTPLMDSKGRVTSHLSGLFYRTINFMEAGIKPVYVFDGRSPEIKFMEVERRRKIKEEAVKKYEEALSKGDLESAKKYAQMASKLSEDMVKQSKRLLEAMGVPWIQAPAEGEAQAAYMTARGDAWASASQDYDSLLFGSQRLLRNLTISGKRKLPGKEAYIDVKPELIELSKLLSKLGLTREQLIAIGILIGTDFNPEGVPGVGVKKALQMVKAYGEPEKLLKSLPKSYFPIEPMEIYRFFLNPPHTDEYKLEWREPREELIIRILVDEHDFSHSRVKTAFERLIKSYREHIKGTQKGLETWFSG